MSSLLVGPGEDGGAAGSDGGAAGSELRGEEIVVRRAGMTVLDGVSVSARAGERVAVTGPSGAGKTTLLTVLAGLVPPNSGRVLLDGTPLRPGDRAQRTRIGVIFQGYGLVSLLTAAENVELVLQSAGRPPGEVRERAQAALSAVGLGRRGDHLVEELSGGEQQRVAVARALVINPPVLLADEPTAELDAQTRGGILELIFSVARRGGLVMLATHDDEVAERCSRVLHVDRGRLVEPELATAE